MRANQRKGETTNSFYPHMPMKRMKRKYETLLYCYCYNFYHMLHTLLIIMLPYGLIFYCIDETKVDEGAGNRWIIDSVIDYGIT